MKRILIAYQSRNGTVRRCVERMLPILQGLDVTVADLAESTPDPADYDLFVIGSSVRFGRLLPAVRAYLRSNRNVLAQKTIGLFFCCGLTHESEYYRDVLFPKDLAAAAFAIDYFGGNLRKDSFHGWDRFFVSRMRAAINESEIEDGEFTPCMPGVLPENVDRMADRIRRLSTAL